MGVYHVSACVTSPGGNAHWWISDVYGPQDEPAKIEFLNELHEFRASRVGPWIVGGDFNMIASAADKNNDRLHHRSMRCFRRFLTDEELRDLYLHGRRYTWSSERDPPMLERIDRVLCSIGWEVAHPHCLMRCLSSAASDHAPLLVDCTPRSPGPRRFHFERFWPTLEGFRQTVADAWNAAPPEADPFRRLFVRLKRTAHRLQSWSSRSIGHVAT